MAIHAGLLAKQSLVLSSRASADVARHCVPPEWRCRVHERQLQEPLLAAPVHAEMRTCTVILFLMILGGKPGLDWHEHPVMKKESVEQPAKKDGIIIK